MFLVDKNIPKLFFKGHCFFNCLSSFQILYYSFETRLTYRHSYRCRNAFRRTCPRKPCMQCLVVGHLSAKFSIE
ncbi:hypothetical protein BpHYR1_023724 [Brachionus plicatilis]|uniref:Uncharacterized protein n=1 Tax=Brachionus plicatilis TaxID=10195 RepID=A0A3M7RUD7_BRAPC|nr:hypothetical protein BpHYR1_023724 [Brachionus plicatilis]